MTTDHLKAAAEKYDEKMCRTDPEMNGLSMREEAYIAGAELMRSEITELERKLAIAVGALKSGVGFEPLGFGTLNPRPFSEALASIQAAPTNPVDETMSSGV